ncbi:hypothetical protein GPS59_01185 [Acinetobacter haemolyticus]|nr:hypothetical protein [Acinetobacter haemolyticus]
MENTQKTNKNRFVPAVFGFGAMALATASRAEIDASPVVTEIGGLATPIAAIGAAMLLILVAIKGWKLIRRAM